MPGWHEPQGARAVLFGARYSVDLLKIEKAGIGPVIRFFETEPAAEAVRDFSLIRLTAVMGLIGEELFLKAIENVKLAFDQVKRVSI